MKKLIALACGLFLSFSAHALTPEQNLVLKTNIMASPDLAALAVAGEYDALAQAYNQPSTCTVWKTQVLTDDIMRNGMDWTRVDNLSVGKARIWDWMTRLGTFDASKANIRAGIDAVWVGTAADLAVRATVYTHCKRLATRAEAVFATGACSDASPSVMGFEGELSWPEVRFALVGY